MYVEEAKTLPRFCEDIAEDDDDDEALTVAGVDPALSLPPVDGDALYVSGVGDAVECDGGDICVRRWTGV